MDMKRLVMTMVAAGATLAAVAMPTKAELQKAQEMVSDVTAADMKALRTKAKTPAEVAAKHMELAGQAGNEAEKYILLQGAFKLYAKAGDYEGAANALGTMNREIADMNPEVIVEIYNRAIFSSMKEKAPKLHAIKEAARRQVACRKLLAKAEAAVKANPKDAAAQKKLGECYAELGNWPKALDAFACAGDDLAKTAVAEKDGTAAPQVSGDFWWDFEDGDEMSAYKLHAAELYRTALANDSFQGLARTRAEQRVQACESVSADLPPMKSEVVSSTDVDNANVALGLPFKTKGNESVFDFGGEFGKMEFVRCPPGKVKMRLFGNHKTAEVKISRPFWIQKSPMVIGLAKTVRPDTRGRNNAYQATLDMHVSGIRMDFANRFASALPPGYVVRLPTLAEIQYAYHANAKNRTDPYYDLENFHSGDAVDRLIFMQGDDNARRGKTRPNAWGIFDFGRFERTLDRFAPSDLRFVGISSDEARQKLFKHCQIVELPEPSAVVDPLYWGETSHEYLGVWFCPKFYAAWTYGAGAIRGGDEHTFYRFVIGPDLVAEKRAKGNGDAAAKKTEVAGSSACYPREDFGGELLSSKYEIVEHTGKMNYVHHLDRLFNSERAKRSVGDGFAFEVSAKEKEVGFTLKLAEPITLAGLLVVNRAEVCQERQVPLCVWASEDCTKWERIFFDESVRDEYRIDLSKKNITCKYLRFGRLPGVNNEPFHLARTLVYVKKVDSGISQPSNSSSASAKAPSPKCKMIKGRPAPLKFELAKGIDLELEGCPAGKFTMGYAAGMWNGDGKAAPKHEVMITRPFWIGKFQVTRGQAKSLDVMLNDCHLEVQSAFDGKGGETCAAVMTFDNINAFCRKLTEKFAAEIPTGYVFRLASNAEWEYASKAGNYSEKNPAMLYSGHKESPYILTRHDKLALLKKKNIEWKDSPVVLPPFPGGLKRPNAWGIFDMLGNHPEVTMDRIPKNAPDIVSYVEGKESGIIRAITYAKQEMDPLLYCEADWNLLVRGRWDNYLLMEGLPANRVQYEGGHGYAFRVCLGPDLVAEKKAKGK